MLLYTVALLIVLLDQASKLLIRHTLPLGQSVPVIPHFFHLTHTENPGAAFSFLAAASDSFRGPFFISVSVAAIILILYYYHRHLSGKTLSAVGLSLILGGAIGNLVDRLSLGVVVDFLDLFIGPYHWPIFNVADAAITTGVGLLLLETFRDRPAPRRAP